MKHLSDIGSATDINCYLKNGSYSVEYLKNEILHERAHRGRVGVIALYQRIIKKLLCQELKKN
jgi:hypothetical protein